jgi:Transcriptional regulators
MNVNYSSFIPDNLSPVPLYYQIERFLRGLIDRGELTVDQMLPPETELAEIFGVSRSTMRQAIAELVHSDLLYRQKGRGTFVRPPKIVGQSLQILTSFDDEIRRKGRIPGTKVLEQKIVTSPEQVCTALGLVSGAKVLYLRRLRFVDGEPVLFFETYLPADKYPGLEATDFERSSLYDTLETRYNTRVDRVIRRVEVSNADRTEAELLGIKRGDAIFRVTFTGYRAEEPVEYSTTRYRGDKNEFVVELRR